MNYFELHISSTLFGVNIYFILDLYQHIDHRILSIFVRELYKYIYICCVYINWTMKPFEGAHQTKHSNKSFHSNQWNHSQFTGQLCVLLLSFKIHWFLIWKLDLIVNKHEINVQRALYNEFFIIFFVCNISLAQHFKAMRSFKYRNITSFFCCKI